MGSDDNGPAGKNLHEKGSGGLFFGPPEAPSTEAEGIGFAPDLDDGGPTDALFDDATASHGPASHGHASHGPVSHAPAPRAWLAGTPARGRDVGYPLAEAALARLLGEGAPEARAPEAAAAPADVEIDDGPFAIGPSIMRPPPDIARRPSAPAPDGSTDDDAPRARTDALMEDMVDMMLVGDDEGRPEVHLSFKEDVFGGLYLRLERTDGGLFAHFHVADDRARRQVESYAEDLLARLSSKGLRVKGWDVVVRSD